MLVVIEEQVLGMLRELTGIDEEAISEDWRLGARNGTT